MLGEGGGGRSSQISKFYLRLMPRMLFHCVCAFVYVCASMCAQEHDCVRACVCVRMRVHNYECACLNVLKVFLCIYVICVHMYLNCAYTWVHTQIAVILRDREREGEKDRQSQSKMRIYICETIYIYVYIHIYMYTHIYI